MRLLAVILFLSATFTNAASYYVDFAAGNDTNAGTIVDPLKHAPGMTGFAGSATLSAGDVVMFNGGVVWTSNCFPLTTTVGTVGSPVTYTSYGTGRPRFSGGSSWSGDLIVGSAQNINLFNLHFEHVGDTNSPGSGGVMRITNPTSLTVSNCLFAADCSHGIILVHYPAVVPCGNVLIVSNDFTRLANAIEIGSGSGGPYTYAFTNLTITGNHFHDFTLWQTDHGDGIHLFNHNNIRNVLINLNRWDGSFAGDDPVNVTANTGFIYFEAAPTDAQIINNVFAPQDTVAPYNNTYIVSPGMIVGSATNWLIANNTFYSAMLDRTIGPKSPIALGIPRNLGITNNIFYNFQYGLLAIYYESAPGVDWFSDHNAYYNVVVPVMWGATNGWYVPDACAAKGLDCGSTTNQPSFINTPTNLRLSVSDTAAIGKGVALNSYFTTDITGLTRGATWDIGAYEFSSDNSSIFKLSSQVSLGGNVRIQ